MKRYLPLIFLFCLFSIASKSQTVTDFCAAAKWTKDYSSSPEFIQQKSQQMELQKGNLNNKSMTLGDSIPVVVHVVWSTTAMNIPDSVIFRQIQILNEDYSRLNDDTSNTPTPFKALAGATPFRFVLARRDPNGAFTTGIIRHQTTHGPFIGFYDLSSNANGGDNAWNGSYLNIYCCELASPAAGVAMFNFSRVAIGYSYWGYNGNTKNKVGTHEVGHCFGLEHIWGSETTTPYNCASDDGVADTPAQYEPSLGCPTFPMFDQCSSSGNGIMFCNYMDYSSGTCQNMFSNGQITAMISNVNSYQSALLNSNGDIPVKQVDAGCSRILSPTGNACNTYSPLIQLRNWGLDTLTSAIINYKVDNNSVLTYNWIGSLSNYQATIITLPSVTIPTGVLHRLKVYSSLPNNLADQDASNDTASVAFVAQPTVVLPMFEGFEGPSFPLNVGAYNPDGDNGFLRNTTIGHTGTGSCYIDNGYSISNRNHYDEINFKVNLFNSSHAYLSFYVANTSSAPLGSSDTLEVYSSTDCGLNYTQLYRKFDSLLFTAPVIPFGTSFIPTSTQWRKDSIDLTNYSTISNDVLLTFRNISGYGLELYLDDVRINNTITGIADLNTNEEIVLYPNPNNGNFKLKANGIIQSVEITDVVGRIVYSSGKIKSSTWEINSLIAKGDFLLSAKTDIGIIHKIILVE